MKQCLKQGKAIHWFDFELFYQEVFRVSKPSAIVAILGYGLVQIHPTIDQVVQYLYKDILGGYWDEERRFIDEHYSTIPFPFDEITDLTTPSRHSGLWLNLSAISIPVCG
ncbi:MAG: hypothetical protein JXQ90_01590 [Cyclobacteriaceae bacterium]